MPSKGSIRKQELLKYPSLLGSSHLSLYGIPARVNNSATLSLYKPYTKVKPLGISVPRSIIISQN